jgi:hypothetical protein
MKWEGSRAAICHRTAVTVIIKTSVKKVYVEQWAFGADKTNIQKH